MEIIRTTTKTYDVKFHPKVWDIPMSRFLEVRRRNNQSTADGYINMQLMVPEGDYPYTVHDIYTEPGSIGKTVFLTREAAAERIKEGRE